MKYTKKEQEHLKNTGADSFRGIKKKDIDKFYIFESKLNTKVIYKHQFCNECQFLLRKAI